MWFLIFATIALCAIIYKLFSPKNEYWEKRGVFVVDTSPAVKPYEVLLSWKSLFEADDYAYLKMGNDHKFCGVYESGQPRIVVKDMELLKKVMIKDFDYFVDRRNLFNENDGTLNLILPSLRGEEWKGVRSSVSPTFTTGKIRRMMEIFNGVGKEWVELFNRQAYDSKDSAAVIDVVTAVNQYTVDVIASAVFGLNSGTIKNPNSAFGKYANRLTDFKKLQLLKFGLRLNFPGLTRLLKISPFDMEALNFFQDLLDQGLKSRMAGHSVRNDFLQLLIEAKKGELKSVGSDELSAFEKEANISASDKKQYLTDDIMLAQTVVFFLAGFSTTTNFITFALYALALHKDVQERLRKEVDSTFKEDGSLDYDDLGRLTYLDMVACEVLRKFSAGARLERLCTKDYKDEESGLSVPKGTLVIIPVNAIHNDPEYYHNPSGFDPEHFTPDRKAARPSYTHMPFGSGPRNCIGMRFALVEGKAAIAHLVHHFYIEPTPKTPKTYFGRKAGLQFLPPSKLELKLVPIQK